MNLSDLNREIESYSEAMSTPEDVILEEIRRFTWLSTSHPRMVSGLLQGRFLEFISCMIQPARVLEIGTFTGYSAICLARGLRKGGELITIDINDELASTSLRFFEKAGLSDSIRLITGNALEIITELEGEFDLIFIDAEKEDYPKYYELLMPKLMPLGFMLADNVLWDGKVLDEDKYKDTATLGLRKFTELARSNTNTTNLLLPLRDGLMIIRKN